MFISHLRTSIIILGLFTVITGVFYPLLVTAIAQTVFPEKSNGSFLKRHAKVVGSELIGQPFKDPKYFWSRPSATAPYPYNAAASAASNYGPLNPLLIDQAKTRLNDLRSVDSLNTKPVPVDLVTSSGSGLDPHISVAAALYQVDRVARNRHTDSERIRSLVEHYTEGRTLGFLGEPRVNVLKLNLALDEPQSLGSK